MASFINNIIVFFLFSLLFSHLSEIHGYFDQVKDKESFENMIDHILYLASEHAKPEERAQFIKNGSYRSAEYISSSFPYEASDADVVFDCKVRKLAFDFAKKISSRGLRDIFDGLKLHSQCNFTFDSNVGRIKKDYIFFNESNGEQLEVFVDNTNDNINYDGSFENPFPSIVTAIEFCTAKRWGNDIPCQISIRGGVYHIQEPIVIRSDNIRLIAYRNEDVHITSDVVVKPKWKLFKRKIEVFKGLNPIFEGVKPGKSTKSVIFVGILNNDTSCEETCNHQSRCTSFAFFGKTTAQFANHCYIRVDGKWNTVKVSDVVSGKKILIYSSDLSGYHLHNVNSVFVNNRRAIRARYPNADPETMGLHTYPTGYVRNAVKWLPPHPTSDAMEIHIDKPNRTASLFPTFSLGIGGPVYQFNPPQSYWGKKKPVGGGPYTYKVPSGLQYSDDLEINLRSWMNPSTGILHTFQHYHWGNWIFKLDGRNETTKTLVWTYGGFQEARGGTDGKEWYVENIFEELDVANEWFYDEKTKILYYSPNTTKDDLPSTLSIPQSDSLLQVIGTRFKPVKNIVIKGLSFVHTKKTFLKPYAVPSGGGWTVHRNASVYLEGTENALIDHCTFDSPEGNGLMISNYNRGTQISNNLLFRLGDNGIVLIGDTHLIDGSRGEQPRGVKVLRNIIFNNGIWGKQTYPFAQTLSCESFLRGNIFFNGPRAGINFNDGFGGGNVIESNLLFNFVRETDDHGPINTWDRVPYITNVFDGEQFSLKVKENYIHYNFIINNYRSVWPIDHDDGSCYWTDTHNYLVYGGFKNYFGHSKRSMFNIYVYPDRDGGGRSAPYCVDTRGQGLETSGYGDIYQENKCIIGKANIYMLGNCEVSHMSQLIPALSKNHYYTPNAKLIAHCGSETWNLDQFREHGMEVGSIVENLVGDDEVIKWGKDLLEI